MSQTTPCSCNFLYYFRNRMDDLVGAMELAEATLDEETICPSDVESALKAVGDVHDIVIELFQSLMVAQEMFNGRSQAEAWDYLYAGNDQTPDQSKALAALKGHIEAFNSEPE